MNSLYDLIGVESELPEVAMAIRRSAMSFDVPIVGAHHVCCSDESEWQCADVFHKVVVEPLLPRIQPDQSAAFHTMNLGARYEPGSARIAEHHYATNGDKDRAKLMIVKISAHTAVGETADSEAFGKLDRYGVASNCCGALAAMFTEAALPALDELRETFRAGGVDRMSMLQDAAQTDPSRRALFTAVVNARLQAARAVEDVTGYQPYSPTVFLIVPCVTINRSTTDTELVLGQYVVDATEAQPVVNYRGLGDVPTAYQLDRQDDKMILRDDRWPEDAKD